MVCDTLTTYVYICCYDSTCSWHAWTYVAWCVLIRSCYAATLAHVLAATLAYGLCYANDICIHMLLWFHMLVTCVNICCLVRSHKILLRRYASTCLGSYASIWFVLCWRHLLLWFHMLFFCFLFCIPGTYLAQHGYISIFRYIDR